RHKAESCAHGDSLRLGGVQPGGAQTRWSRLTTILFSRGPRALSREVYRNVVRGKPSHRTGKLHQPIHLPILFLPRFSPPAASRPLPRFVESEPHRNARRRGHVRYGNSASPGSSSSHH